MVESPVATSIRIMHVCNAFVCSMSGTLTKKRKKKEKLNGGKNETQQQPVPRASDLHTHHEMKSRPTDENNTAALGMPADGSKTSFKGTFCLFN